MKHLKKKLMAATAMMLLSAIMLTGTSYAWFTLSTNPEIKEISATVSGNENLEIALDVNGAAPGASGTSDSGTYTTWGNLVDLTGDATLGKIELQPVNYNSTSHELEYPTYGEDGRISGLTAFNVTDKGVTAYNDGHKDIAFSVTFWLRSNVAGAVSLTTGVSRQESSDMPVGGGSTVTGSAPGLNIMFSDGESWTEGVIKDGAITATGITTLAANTAKKVTMYVFIDGTEVDNTTALTGNGSVKLNVQFDNAALTDSDAMDGNFKATVDTP